jgi:hypothetical protein
MQNLPCPLLQEARQPLDPRDVRLRVVSRRNRNVVELLNSNRRIVLERRANLGNPAKLLASIGREGVAEVYETGVEADIGEKGGGKAFEVGLNLRVRAEKRLKVGEKSASKREKEAGDARSS